VNYLTFWQTNNMMTVMAKEKKQPKVTDQLRHLIRESGVTCYVIAQQTGVSNAALSRFLSGSEVCPARL